MNQSTSEKLEASFSMLIMSIASNALMAMGHTSDPSTGQVHIDKQMARFNIDLLLNLKEKTKNNLNSDEQGLLEQIMQDLQLKFMRLN
jgi:hypothetical protein